jgi:hypothetical protein
MSKLNDIYVIISKYDDLGDQDVKLCRTPSRAEDIVHGIRGFDPKWVRVYRVLADPDDEEPGEYTPFEDPTQTVSEEIAQLRFDRTEAVS